MWPKIETVKDVLPHIADRPEFTLAEREWGFAIDYNYVTPETFSNPVALECRGLKFDRDGKLIARPYHKFFNVGEKEHTQVGALPWSGDHHVLEKLDGSMVHPAASGGKILWMTRAGVSDVAKEAAKRVCGKIARCAHDLIAIRATPIFEWVAPENRIVVRYTRDELVLTGVRYWHGDYWPYEAVRHLAEGYGIPFVRAYNNVTDAAAFLAQARDLRDAEGYVVRWADGSMVKVKADEYCRMHKAKDGLSFEKDVLALVLNNGVDDVLPLLGPDDRAALEEYASKLCGTIDSLCSTLNDVVATSKARLGGDRKRFALEVVNTLHRPLRHVAYHVWEGKDARGELTRHMLKHTNSRAAVDELRCILGPVKWDRIVRMEAA